MGGENWDGVTPGPVQLVQRVIQDDPDPSRPCLVLDGKMGVDEQKGGITD